MAYELKKEINKAIKDEQKAPKDYMRLKKFLKNENDKKTIEGIIKDEKTHAKKLKKLKKKYN